jgi:hypothetical protein
MAGAVAVTEAPARPAADDASQVIFDGEVTLPPRAAVDVDTPSPTPVNGQIGPVGKLDLYHVDRASPFIAADSLRVSTSNVFPFPSSSSTSSASSYGLCAEYTDPAASHTSESAAGIYADRSFCFVTSDHHMAWADIEALQDNTKTVTLHVRVWDKVVPD